MPKVSSLKTKADYRSPTTKGKYQATDVQIDWEGPVLHHKDGLFWKKLAFKDVVGFHVGAEPGGKPDKFGRLKILHIIKLREVTHGKAELREFAFHPDVFENWLYWIIRSLVKHANISLSKEEIKQSPLLQKHKVKTKLFQNVSVFDRTHEIFVNTLNILSNPTKHKELTTDFTVGEGGAKFGRVVKKIGKGGSDTVIFEIIQRLQPLKAGEEEREEPVALKLGSTNIQTDKDKITDLIKEARVLALLGIHPNIVGLVDAVLAENRLCLFMELGKSDLEHLNETLTSHLVLRYARDILAGIAHMHKCRVYHLDMKPGNVIITKRGFAKVIDFGLCRSPMLHSKKERFEDTTWFMLGTGGYISPESWVLGQQDIKSDTELAKRDSYAVGMTILNGLLGPFLGLEEVKVEFGEHGQHVLNRIHEWKKRLRKEDVKAALKNNGLTELAEAVIGLIEEDPEQRWTIERAVEFLQADRKKLRREHTRNRGDVLNTLKEQNKKIEQLKKWGV